MPFYPVAAGDLRQVITIQASSTAPVNGESQTSWSTIATLRGKVETLTMREQFQQSAFAEQVSHKITLRYPGASIVIKPGYQAVLTSPDGTHTYKIQSIDNVQQRNRVLVLMALEINAQG